jgi:site-specific DNA recombinase
VLEQQFTDLLGRLTFDEEVIDWVRDALHVSHADERREHEAAIKRLQAEHRRLQDRIHAMYVDKLDGLIDADFFDRMSSGWREQQNRCQRQIELHQAADQSYLDEGVQLMELARSAQRLFANQEPREKRRLLNFVLSNCIWEDGKAVSEFRQPFNLLAETVAATPAGAPQGVLAPAKSENWLGN